MKPCGSQEPVPSSSRESMTSEGTNEHPQGLPSPEASASLHSMTVHTTQDSRVHASRTRRARPGAHFQAPPSSPRSPLSCCNTLFFPSTIQAAPSIQLLESRVKEPKSAPVSDKPVELRAQPSTPCKPQHEGTPILHQTHSAAASPSSRHLLSPNGSLRAAKPSDSSREAHQWHFSSSSSRGGIAAGGAAHKPRVGPLYPTGGPLLPSSLHLKTQRQLNNASPGKRLTAVPRNVDVSLQGAQPLKIFCGTWNCQYQDFPVSVLTNSQTAVRVPRLPDCSNYSACTLSGSPNSCATECLPDELPAEVIAKMGGEFDKLYDLEGMEKHGWQQPTNDSAGPPQVHINPPSLARKSTIKRGDLVRSSTKLLTAVQGEDQPLVDWLLPGYDVYVVSLQETLGQSIFETVTVYLSTVNGTSFKRIKFSEDKLSGLGDGAWMQFKSTSLAAWAREDLEGEGKPVSFVSSKAASVSFLSGSKGGVSVCLKIWGQLFCFIGCHMPSTSPEDRRKARAVVEQRLLEFYGGASSWAEAFHHVLWMGDFNFRTQRVTVQRAVSLLKQSPTGLFAFDEWVGPNGDDMRSAGFVEAPVVFPPTYKKADGRPPANLSEPKWVEAEYQTHMITQWYKGARHQDRIPSVRLLFSYLKPGLEVSSLLRFQPDMYFCAMPSRPSFLIASDHSPVGLGLECFPLDFAYALPDVTSNAAAFKKSVNAAIPKSSATPENIGEEMYMGS
ncbi:endonuclease/exonuclease/phosphatase domain-containing protein, putative [Eimeria necatrix]|uniref:Endonuclease/exonuclease/phosphatase domain-containing protein, putative n=1 Tax=Eimeria necatrix TaxID=51315 RepID=U6MQ03_9EIME|nr:endonuclease/exonuclease/phosphatase domain-containing protein, putative [Eimeria necatrix]CDJ63750.1 endonuclease/exonuclease/phosphatase domain-containing protein, putative [Eimeria necatrix]